MQLQIEKLGKVSITVEEGYWDINKDYDKLTIVEKEGTFGTFISRKPVPAGTVLTDRKYWIPFSSLKEEIILNFNKWVSDYGALLGSQAETLNSIQEVINSIYIHLPNGVTFKGDIDSVRAGFEREIILEGKTINKEKVQFILYKNNEEIYRSENSNEFSISDLVSGDTEYKLVTIQNGYKYISTWNVAIALPLYAGGGQTYQDAVEDNKIVKVSNDISGLYSIVVDKDGDYIFFVAPKGYLIKSIKMNGLDVPIKSTREVYLGTDYVIYQSDYQYKAGTYPIQINDYTGLDGEDFLGILSSLGDTASAVDVANLKERIDNLPINELIDKEYAPSKFSGMGRVYLRKNIKNGKNILEQDMMLKSNTIYIIQYDFDLDEKEITVPDNCVLDFQGGSLNNGIINGLFGIINVFLGTANYTIIPVINRNINFIGNKTSYDVIKGNLKETIVDIQDENCVYNLGRYTIVKDTKINNRNKLHGTGIGTRNSINYDSNPMGIILENLEISNFDKGIDLYKANYANLLNLHIYYNKYGIYIDAPSWSGSIVIKNSHIAYNKYGVYINAPNADSIWIDNCTFEGNLHDIVVTGTLRVTNCYFGDQARYDRTEDMSVITVNPNSNVSFTGCKLNCDPGDNRVSSGVLFDILGTDENSSIVNVTNSFIALGSQFSTNCYLYKTLSRKNIINFNNVTNNLSRVNKQHSWNYPQLYNEILCIIPETNVEKNYIVNGYFEDDVQNTILAKANNVSILGRKNLYGGNIISLKKYSLSFCYSIPNKYIGKDMALEIACYSSKYVNSPRVYLTNSDLIAASDLPVESLYGKATINTFIVKPNKQYGRITIFLNDLSEANTLEYTIGFIKLVPIECKNKLDKYRAVDNILFTNTTVSETQTLDRPIYYKTSNGYSIITRFPVVEPSVKMVGSVYFNTTLNKPIYWTGSKWVDATGTDVATTQTE